jgi:hypothetical protein
VKVNLCSYEAHQLVKVNFVGLASAIYKHCYHCSTIDSAGHVRWARKSYRVDRVSGRKCANLPNHTKPHKIWASFFSPAKGMGLTVDLPQHDRPAGYLSCVFDCVCSTWYACKEGDRRTQLPAFKHGKREQVVWEYLYQSPYFSEPKM